MGPRARTVGVGREVGRGGATDQIEDQPGEPHEPGGRRQNPGARRQSRGTRRRQAQQAGLRAVPGVQAGLCAWLDAGASGSSPPPVLARPPAPPKAQDKPAQR